MKCSVNISGDDIKIIPLNKPLPENFAIKNMDAINQQIGAGRIRQSEILAGVKAGEREEVVAHGEKIEKILAAGLSRSPLAAKAKDITFHTRMITDSTGKGHVQIFASGPGLTSMTPEESSVLNRAYADAIRNMNAIDPTHQYVLQNP